MKRKLTLSLIISGLLLAMSFTAHAQTIAPMDQWSFSTSRVEIDGHSYYLDQTNGLAEFLLYYNSTKAKSFTGTFTVPSTVTYNEKNYTVVSMKDYSTYNLENVTKLELPSTLVNLGNYVLGYFPNVDVIEIPASVQHLGNYVVNRDEATIKFLGTTPPAVDGKLSSYSHVKVIVPAQAFQDYKVADYIEDCCVISDDISKQTFHTDKVDNGELGYVVVANQLPEIVTYSDVNKLIVDEGTIDATDWYQLRQMKNLIYLDISGLSITEIPYEALSQCWQIETVILPQTLEAIHGYAFYRTGIRDLILPASLRVIDGGYNFQDCEFLTSIDIPEGVKSLPYRCFYSCGRLHSVGLPSTLATMDSNCFEYCDLYQLEIPGSLKEISYCGFGSNYNLASVTFGEGVEAVRDYGFGDSHSLTTLTFPSSMRRIYSAAFQNNYALTSVKFNEGLEEIDGSAFAYDKLLTEITLPSSLIYCLDRPFYGCSGITKIYTYALIPPTVRNAIPTYEVRDIELYVPQWSFQEYMTKPGWLEYQDHTIIDPNILPENIVINKEFEFVLKPEQMKEGYNPNIRMLANTEQIDDGFGHQKYERGNLTISSRSKLNVNNFEMIVAPFAKFYSDQSRFYNNNGLTYDDSRSQYSPNSLFVRGEMRAQNQVYHLQLCNDRWQFVSFPFDVKVGDITPDDALTQWVIRKYDGEKRAAQDFENTWVNLTSDDILEAGKGYIIKCYNSDSKYYYNYWSYNSPVTFTLTPIANSLTKQQLFDSNDREVELGDYVSEFEQNRSWNLIGNPYPSYFDTRYINTESPFLVWNSWDNSYAAFSPVDDNYILEPGEAFFIQRPVNQSGNLKFLKEGRQTYRNPNDLTVTARPMMATAANRTVINLLLSNGDKSDRTRVVFNDNAQMKYEISRDAAKFMAESLETPQIWSVGGSVKYAINERPVDNGIVELAVRCGQQGAYTISLGDNSGATSVFLEDRVLGTNTEISAAEAYTFNVTEAGTITGRFYLAPAGTVTGISTIEKQTADSENYFNLNGQRVNASQRGLLIKNGKKVLNK